ncbi:MAG: MBL fold metallo-hydrolase [Synergistaceae bacterium]|nr:MBL fold metallo-hydrolase [Synergistaceae bacterium]
MHELIQLTERNFYIQSPAKIGLIKLTDNEVCLIDSGSDKEAGRKVRQVLDAHKWKLTAIYNTHSNADHIGGNKYLQAQTKCKIYAPDVECAFTRHPVLEPAFLYGGFPMKELRHKFLMAQESDAEYLTPESLPDCLEMINLPGHFFSMAGFRTSDDVIYLADCLASKSALEKYGITFLYDVGAYLSTLEKVKGMTAKFLVPSHSDVTENNISELAEFNIAKVNEVADTIIKLCAEPLNFETILQKIFTRFNLTMTFEQYALVGSTVRSYLSWLKENGRLEAYFEGNMLLWRKI